MENNKTEKETYYQLSETELRKAFNELLNAGRDMQDRDKMGLYYLPKDEYFDVFKRKFSPVPPLSKVREVTDEEIRNAAYFLWKETGAEFQNGETRWLEFWDKHEARFRSLLQPQPVNSEGKGKADNYSKIHSALFELVKLKDYKDANGKTEAYVKKQKEAWEYAKQVLSVSSEGKKEEKECAMCGGNWPVYTKADCTECSKSVEQGEAKEPSDEILHNVMGRFYFSLEAVNEKEPSSPEQIKMFYEVFGNELRSLFRSSEVKEQVITEEKIKLLLRKYFWQIPWSEDFDWQTNRFNANDIILFVRSLQVKSNEQTKKDE